MLKIENELTDKEITFNAFKSKILLRQKDLKNKKSKIVDSYLGLVAKKIGVKYDIES